jgi:hypothetical protein
MRLSWRSAAICRAVLTMPLELTTHAESIAPGAWHSRRTTSSWPADAARQKRGERALGVVGHDGQGGNGTGKVEGRPVPPVARADVARA